MQHESGDRSRVERLVTGIIVVTLVTTAIAIAATFLLGADAAEPVAFVAGAMIVLASVGSIVTALRPEGWQCPLVHQDLAVSRESGAGRAAKSSMDANVSEPTRGTCPVFRAAEDHGPIPFW